MIKVCVINMTSRRDLISKDELNWVATAAAAYGVVLKGASIR